MANKAEPSGRNGGGKVVKPEKRQEAAPSLFAATKTVLDLKIILHAAVSGSLPLNHAKAGTTYDVAERLVRDGTTIVFEDPEDVAVSSLPENDGMREKGLTYMPRGEREGVRGGDGNDAVAVKATEGQVAGDNGESDEEWLLDDHRAWPPDQRFDWPLCTVYQRPNLSRIHYYIDAVPLPPHPIDPSRLLPNLSEKSYHLIQYRTVPYGQYNEELATMEEEELIAPFMADKPLLDWIKRRYKVRRNEDSFAMAHQCNCSACPTKEWRNVERRLVLEEVPNISATGRREVITTGTQRNVEDDRNHGGPLVPQRGEHGTNEPTKRPRSRSIDRPTMRQPEHFDDEDERLSKRARRQHPFSQDPTIDRRDYYYSMPRRDAPPLHDQRAYDQGYGSSYHHYGPPHFSPAQERYPYAPPGSWYGRERDRPIPPPTWRGMEPYPPAPSWSGSPGSFREAEHRLMPRGPGLLAAPGWEFDRELRDERERETRFHDREGERSAPPHGGLRHRPPGGFMGGQRLPGDNIRESDRPMPPNDRWREREPPLRPPSTGREEQLPVRSFQDEDRGIPVDDFRDGSQAMPPPVFREGERAPPHRNDFRDSERPHWPKVDFRDDDGSYRHDPRGRDHAPRPPPPFQDEEWRSHPPVPFRGDERPMHPPASIRDGRRAPFPPNDGMRSPARDMPAGSGSTYRDREVRPAPSTSFRGGDVPRPSVSPLNVTDAAMRPPSPIPLGDRLPGRPKERPAHASSPFKDDARPGSRSAVSPLAHQAQDSSKVAEEKSVSPQQRSSHSRQPRPRPYPPSHDSRYVPPLLERDREGIPIPTEKHRGPHPPPNQTNDNSHYEYHSSWDSHRVPHPQSYPPIPSSSRAPVSRTAPGQFDAEHEVKPSTPAGM
ncbi:hypothetical protein BT69DRAFT_1355133 [Atractiella rhizophila]|nr:hypothetical protein BT69DRAFT_1355133 [Atractiella rhizophila]